MSYVTMDEGMVTGSITGAEFCQFHSIDRALYSVLVTNLHRDPVESMVVIAFLLWLERKGFKNVVASALTFPNLIIDELAKEAVTCLKHINVILGDQSSLSSREHGLPFMRKLIDKEITARFFSSMREGAHKGVCDIFGKVCVDALLDIMQAAIMERSIKAPEHSSTHVSPSIDHRQLHVQERGLPGIVRPQQFEASMTVPSEDRTLFVTFSKGYPVQEWEVREFLTRSYGDCIESLHMQEVPTFEQSLFARVVFRSATTINLILNSWGKAKFVINGKHVWARKFVPKRNKTNELPPHRSQLTLPPSFPYSI